MSTEAEALACPPECLSAVLETAQADDARGLAAVEELLASYPGDPRLQFLRGSLLAGRRRYPEAREAMAAAVRIAPEYAIARFQLGLLELTSGEPAAALGTWGPLQMLPPDNALHLFAAGLTHMIRDEWAETITKLEKGIASNNEILPLNRDMQMVIDECRRKLEGGDTETDSEPVSAVQQLLQQFGKGTKH